MLSAVTPTSLAVLAAAGLALVAAAAAAGAVVAAGAPPLTGALFPAGAPLEHAARTRLIKAMKAVRTLADLTLVNSFRLNKSPSRPATPPRARPRTNSSKT